MYVRVRRGLLKSRARKTPVLPAFNNAHGPFKKQIRPQTLNEKYSYVATRKTRETVHTSCVTVANKLFTELLYRFLSSRFEKKIEFGSNSNDDIRNESLN